MLTLSHQRAPSTTCDVGAVELTDTAISTKLKPNEISDLLTNPEFNFNLESNTFGQFNLVDNDNLIDILNKESSKSTKTKEKTEFMIRTENNDNNDMKLIYDKVYNNLQTKSEIILKKLNSNLKEMKQKRKRKEM